MSRDDTSTRITVVDVRFWAISRYVGSRSTTYTVRWSVNGRPHQRTFSTKRLAEHFRSELQIAARAAVPFSLETGMPAEQSRTTTGVTWYSLACEFIDHKWPRVSPRHRKGLAEALTALTMALFDEKPRASSVGELKKALFSWSFNTPARAQPVPEELRRAVEWIGGHSVTLEAMSEPKTLHAALGAVSTKADGKVAAPSTVRKKHAALHSVLKLAVELGYLESSPLDRISWHAPAVTETVDRRVVVNPTTARALLAAVREISGPLEGYFACLYFAGLRPGEAANLRVRDCQLPESGWGHLLLSGSYQISGKAWTTSGAPGEEQPLKHRAARETRVVPAVPELVATLRHHIDEYGVGVGGRLFVTRTGKAGVPLAGPYSNPISMGTAYRVWNQARRAALTPEQFASPLARRPYDLRHACLSTWLNAGVPATQVAAWAGHSVMVLLKVYAQCLEGQDEMAMRNIDAALALPEDHAT
jgi:integrase